jgi:hypothetical protein
MSGATMATVRRALAFPFYLIAFVLHLLTAFFAIIAQKIAGDESEPSRKTDIILSSVLCIAVVSTVPLWVQAV